MQMVKKALIAFGLAGYGASIRLNAQTKTLIQAGSKNNHVLVQNRFPGNADCGCHGNADCLRHPIISSNNLCLPDPYHYKVSHVTPHDAHLEEANATAQCTFSARQFQTGVNAEPWRNSIDALRRLKHCQSQTEVTCGTVEGCVWKPLTVEQKAKKGQACDNDDRLVYPAKCTRLDEVGDYRNAFTAALAGSPELKAVISCVYEKFLVSGKFQAGTNGPLAQEINSFGATAGCRPEIWKFAKTNNSTIFGRAFDAAMFPVNDHQTRQINTALMNATYTSIIYDLYQEGALNQKEFRSKPEVVEFLMSPNHPVKTDIAFNDTAIVHSGNTIIALERARSFWIEQVRNLRGTLRLAVPMQTHKAHGLWEADKNDEKGCKDLRPNDCHTFTDDYGTRLCKLNNNQCWPNDQFLNPGPNDTTYFKDGTPNQWAQPFDDLKKYETTATKHSQHVSREAMKHGRKLGFVDPQNDARVKVKAYVARIVDALTYFSNNEVVNNKHWMGVTNGNRTERYFDMVYLGPKDRFYSPDPTEQWMWHKIPTRGYKKFANKWGDM